MKLAACLLISGISLYRIFPFQLGFSISITLIFIIVFIISLRFESLSKFGIWIACLAILGLGFSLITVSATRLNSERSVVRLVPLEGGKAICEGRVADSRRSIKGRRLIVDHLRCLEKDELVPAVGNLRLTISESPWYLKRPLAPGDIIRFRAGIRRPRDFKNFGRSSFETYCFSKGISAVGYSDPNWVVKVGCQRGLIDRVVYSWRGSVAAAATEGLGDTQELQLIRALVLGDRSGFDWGMIEGFRSLGIIHLLVVSGLHVAVLAGISWWSVILLGSLGSVIWGQRDMRSAASVISLMLIWAFVALTGFGTPAVRAGLIVTTYLGAILTRRAHDPWDSLALAAIVILLINPGAVFDISFQLTFAAVAGILVFARFLLRWNDQAGRLRKLLYTVANMGVVSAGASLGVFPLLAYHFEKIPTVGPVISILLSPIITVAIVPLSLVAALVTPLSASLGAEIFGLLSKPAWLFLKISEGLAGRLNWSVVEMGLNWWTILTFYGLIIIIIYGRRLYFRKIFISVAVVFLGLGLIMPYPFENSRGKLAVTFLDVGQGAAVVVRLPDGRVTLIDGGGIKGSHLDFGKSVLEPFLKKIGVEGVDRVIVTHPHPDHFKGLGYIAENFGPRVCMVGSYPKEGLSEEDASEWNTFLGRVEGAGINIEPLEPADWSEAGVEFSVYSPPTEIPAGWNVNDASGVIKIEFGEVSFLITGDIESAAEAYVVDNEFDLESTVLQVPHHGSASSSSDPFLDEVSPKYGVIQVGAFNKYGFPEEEVITRFAGRDIKLYRTDQDGAITFITDGQELKIFSTVSR